MPSFTFEMPASVTVDSETEEQAREILRNSLMYQEEDVCYNGVGVYLPSTSAVSATLTDIYTFKSHRA